MKNCTFPLIVKTANMTHGFKKGYRGFKENFSKAFDCLSHELIIYELNAYGFIHPTLKLMHSYLSNRKQHSKVNLAYSSWEQMLLGIPQVSISRSTLFNFFLSDLLLVIGETEFSCHVDDNTYI